MQNLILFFSQFTYLLAFYLASVLYYYSDRKSTRVLVAVSSFFVSGLFFSGQYLFVKKGFAFILNFSSYASLPAFFILIFLPLAWLGIVVRFLNEKRSRFLFPVLVIVSFAFGNCIYLLNHVLNSPAETVIQLWRNIPSYLLEFFSAYILLSTFTAFFYTIKFKEEDTSLSGLPRISALSVLRWSSFLLFFVALFVSYFLYFSRDKISKEFDEILLGNVPVLIYKLDIAISFIIFILVLLVGRAITGYQAFTGKFISVRAVPVFWKGFLVLSLFYCLIGLFMESNSDSPWRDYYLSLLYLLGVIVFQRIQFQESQENNRYLKPFLQSENIYEYVTSDSSVKPDFEEFFRILCDNTLHAGSACLIPEGVLSFRGDPLFYNSNLVPESSVIRNEWKKNKNKQYFQINRADSGDYIIVLPVHNGNDLTGLLYLGVKRDYTLYSEEELEIAKIASRKILDLIAVAELTRRLLELQKRQLIENRLLDVKTRRFLHDEVLPELHMILLAMDSLAASPKKEELLGEIMGTHRKISSFLKSLPSHIPDVTPDNYVSVILSSAKSELGEADLQFELKEIPDSIFQNYDSVLLEVVYYAFREILRNINRYARVPGKELRVRISLEKFISYLEICVEDNGPGFGKESSKGTNQGLLLHGTMLATVGCSLVKESAPGETRLKIRIPIPRGLSSP